MTDFFGDDERFAGDLDPSKPVILLLGFAPEGVTDAMKAAGRQYKIKLLESKPANWAQIARLFDQYDVRSVLIVLTGGAFERLADPDYSEAASTILSKIAVRPHLAVAFEALVFPISEESEDPEALDRPRDFGRTDPEALRAGGAVLNEHNIRLVPYRRNADLTVLASSFINDTEEGLLFKCYVPKGRIWANELDRILVLFRDYLSRTRQHEIRLQEFRTNHGVIYKLLGDNETTRSDTPKQNLGAEFSEFSNFLQYTLDDPGRAESLLRDRNVAPEDIAKILERYSKEARRLQIDMKQEREKKFLSIRHRLETELTDSFTQLAAAQIEGLVNGVIEESDAGLMRPVLSGLSMNSRPTQAITINLQPRIVNAVNSIIAEEVSGDVRFGPEDKQILELIREHDPQNEAELSSALRELADDSAPRTERLEAKQRLKGFLYSVASKGSDIAIGLFTAYLEKKMGLS